MLSILRKSKVMLLPNIPCSSGLDPEKSEIQLEIDEEGN
jgi:hypothetical protein